MRIEFSEVEGATLRDALGSYVSDLRLEIADNDRMDFREGLTERRKVLEGLVQRLEATA